MLASVTAAPADVVRASPAAPAPESRRLELRRRQSLVALCAMRQRALAGMRVARFVGLAVALIGVVALLVVSGSPGRDVLHAIAAQGIGWLSWTAGALATLSAARDLASLDHRDGIAALALERGYSRRALARARTAASVRVITRILGLPALMLAVSALALTSSLALVAPRVLFVVGICGYVAALGTVLGLLSRWSAAMSPTRGRVLLVAIMLLPELARQTWPSVPSIPAAFAWFLEQLTSIGSTAP
jgi:hypothetical protein